MSNPSTLIASDQAEDSNRSGPEAYRYERVTIGLLMGDLQFRKNTSSAGDPFPRFELPTTNGRQIRKDDFVGNRPLLVVFGSNSCPLTISSIEPLKRLHQEFGDDIEFVTVNVREAHPGENNKQPINFEQKLRNAQIFKTRYEIPWNVAVDDIEGTLHRALDAKPNAAYLMDVNGNIAYRTLVAGDDTALAQALLSVSEDRPMRKSESRAMLKPMLRAIGFIDSVLKEAGPQAQRDMLRVAPPLILASKIASLFHFIPKPQRGAVAITSIVVAMATLAVGAVGILN